MHYTPNDASFEGEVHALLRWVMFYGRLPVEEDFLMVHEAGLTRDFSNGALVGDPFLPKSWHSVGDVIKTLLFSFESAYANPPSFPASYNQIKELLFDCMMNYMEKTSSFKKIHGVLFEHLKHHPCHGKFFLAHQEKIWDHIRAIGDFSSLFLSFFERQKAKLIFHAVFPFALCEWIKDESDGLDGVMVFVDRRLETLYQNF